jgi:hypothetical protein
MSGVESNASHRALGAAYEAQGVEEHFAKQARGIEQTFTLEHRPSGPGPLVISIPVSGLSAYDASSPCSDNGKTSQGLVPDPKHLDTELNRHVSNTESHRCTYAAAIDLDGSKNIPRVVYSNLVVTDATGRIVPSSMSASPDHNSILIRVSDVGSTYPLMVDPTWSEIQDFPDPANTSDDYFGACVQVSGDNAVVGGFGGVYTFSEGSDGYWSETGELEVDGDPVEEGIACNVAISGTTVVVGDEEVGPDTDEGAAFVFTESDGVWAESAELQASDANAWGDFGECGNPPFAWSHRVRRWHAREETPVRPGLP